MQADRDKIRADGQDLSFVTVTVEDKDGLLVPALEEPHHFEISGPGEIVATDNGDATSFESFQAPERNAFNGLASSSSAPRPASREPSRSRPNPTGLNPPRFASMANERAGDYVLA